jgi:hypothetical protein
MTMYEICKSKLVYVCVCAMFAVAVCTSILAGGSVPGFGSGLLPESTVAQLPTPPPDPDGPWVTLAGLPVPPPDPDGPWVTLAGLPVPPPDPDGPWVAVA